MDFLKKMDCKTFTSTVRKMYQPKNEAMKTIDSQLKEIFGDDLIDEKGGRASK